MFSAKAKLSMKALASAILILVATWSAYRQRPVEGIVFGICGVLVLATLLWLEFRKQRLG
jgi:hypothetical protein